MASEGTELQQRVCSLVDENRARCLWFLTADYYPRTADEIRRTLDHIEKHGDARAFQEADRLRRWLSQTSSAPSVV